jgi:hypothetical protein
MRTSKRLLAGVAAGALGLALVPFVATGASAAGTIAGSVTPVRSADFGTVPPATLSWTSNSIGASTLSLTTAPTAAAKLHADDSTDLFAQLNAPATIPSSAIGTSGTDETLELSATVAGLYVGSLADGTDTVTFSFTTTGAPASISLTPATQSVLVGAPATMTLTIRDANGNTTQPASVDTIALSDNTDDTVSPTSVDSAALASGTATATLTTTGNPAGTTTVTATPQGTLPGLGVAAATATVTKAGTVSATDIAGISVTAPANAVNAGIFPTKTADVPAGSTSVTVTIDDTTAADAGNTIRVGVNTSSGTVNGAAYVNGDDTLYLDLTTDANKKAATTLTLGGTAPLNGQTLTVQQVDVLNDQVGSVELVVTQRTPAITAASVTVAPDDSVIAQLGATTNVQVTVQDQFGNVASGYGVSAYRGTTVPGNLTTGFLSNATTNASGVATVTVTSATGAAVNAVEQYSFAVFTPIGAHISGADKNNALQITYTADGTVTSLSVTASPTLSPPAVTDTTSAVVTAPLLSVVSSGTAEDLTSTTFTVATGVNSSTVDGNYAEFVATASPLNSVTITTPDGVFVAADEDTAWDEGSQSLTVSSATPVRIFATSVGTHDVTFTSGGKTTVVPVKVVNTANDAYNIAITPAEQFIVPSGFGTVTLAVTDVFGNPVTTTDDTGLVRIMASGEVLLPGFVSSANYNTGTDGTITVTFIAGGAIGQGILTATPATAATNAAWQTDYSPPTNAPAPVLSAVAEVGVGEAPIEASILIEGSRENRRINVDGLTTGLPAGTVVKPWLRFPGQVGFTEGAAQRSVQIVDEDLQIGEFAWGRNTGKRTAVQFRDADGLRSNSIIIAAR